MLDSHTLNPFPIWLKEKIKVNTLHLSRATILSFMVAELSSELGSW